MNLFELCDVVRNFDLLIDEETGEILDERFIKYEPKISKTDIKDALKRGEEVMEWWTKL